ncbi:hypothetical protein BU23DRAFT_160553 [Bimuria novae-zelandiae CBS 107.79]|uniref:Uncharacterized protein n=1 Tax=Bimuria novae-zelandiae CBS 107.79 TaxID=1447943 RepID=A0A6A5V7A1_9PLEO|nr:hypothetical protein BU23DRAFT_160553 [Bimuria novae-zelandiae CBS 107.79]
MMSVDVSPEAPGLTVTAPSPALDPVRVFGGLFFRDDSKRGAKTQINGLVGRDEKVGGESERSGSLDSVVRVIHRPDDAGGDVDDGERSGSPESVVTVVHQPHATEEDGTDSQVVNDPAKAKQPREKSVPVSPTHTATPTSPDITPAPTIPDDASDAGRSPASDTPEPEGLDPRLAGLNFRDAYLYNAVLLRRWAESDD